MTISHSQSLEKVLKVIAEAPIQDLNSCSSLLLQEVRDKVCKAVLFDQATENISHFAINQACLYVPQRVCKQRTRLKKTPTPTDISTSQIIQPKPTQECSVIYNQHPPPGPSAEVINENSKANRLFASLLDQITNASRLLENNVEEVLRNGTRQCHEDPRIEDIGKLVGPTVYDEL